MCTSILKAPYSLKKKNLILSTCQVQLVKRSKFRKYKTFREEKGLNKDSILHCKKVLSCQINKFAFFFTATNAIY